MTLRRTLLAAGLVIVLGVSALVTYALWGKQIDVPVGIVTAGNLDIKLVGPPVWTETSSDVSPVHAVAIRPDGATADHLATPGDSFTLTQQFSTELEGDNVAARLTVDWDVPPALAPVGRAVASYTVTDPGGTTTASALLGDDVTLPGGTANFTPQQIEGWGPGATWTLTVTLAYAGADVLLSPDQITTAAPVTELGTIALTLDQVRDGDGFDS